MLEGYGADHITEFGGLFVRGVDDSVPLTHFKTAENLRYFNEGFSTRYGTRSDSTDYESSSSVFSISH